MKDYTDRLRESYMKAGLKPIKIGEDIIQLHWDGEFVALWNSDAHTNAFPIANTPKEAKRLAKWLINWAKWREKELPLFNKKEKKRRIKANRIRKNHPITNGYEFNDHIERGCKICKELSKNHGGYGIEEDDWKELEKYKNEK